MIEITCFGDSPFNSIINLRKDFLTITGKLSAAVLLDIFDYQTRTIELNIVLDKEENKRRARAGQPLLHSSFWISASINGLKGACFNIFDESEIYIGLECLSTNGFIERRLNTRAESNEIDQYLLNKNAVRQALDAYVAEIRHESKK